MYLPVPAVPTTGTRKLGGRRGVTAAVLGAVIFAGAASVLVAEFSTSGTATAATVTATIASAPPDDPADPWQSWANEAGPRPGIARVTAVSSATITATAEDGATITIHTGPATSYSRITKAPRSAIRAGEHVLVIGERSGQATLDASAVVIGSSPDDGLPGGGPVGEWTRWRAVAGKVSSITGDSLSVVDAQGSTMTIKLSSSTDILSAVGADHRDVSPGKFVRADETGLTGGVAGHVIVADQPLPFAGRDCPWAPPAVPSGSLA
jgi:hypothetical protein